MSEPRQRFFESDRLRLAYWEWGDEAAPPVVLVHGLRDHSRTWDRLAEALAVDYRVLALDLRGHGDSQWSTGSHYGWPEYALDLVALVDVLGGRVRVVAHSVGGGVALFAAGAFPERFAGIVAIEGMNPAWFGPRPPGPQRLRQWAAAVREQEERDPRVYPTFEDAVARMREANRRLSPPLAEHLVRHGSRAVEGGLVWKYDPWLLTQHGMELRGPELPSYWSEVACPVLHLVGMASPLREAAFAGRPIESYFRNAHTLRVPQAHHWVHHDQHDVTLAAVREFLMAVPRR